MMISTCATVNSLIRKLEQVGQKLQRYFYSPLQIFLMIYIKELPSAVEL
jgi:hypothetical protein